MLETFLLAYVASVVTFVAMDVRSIYLQLRTSKAKEDERAAAQAQAAKAREE